MNTISPIIDAQELLNIKDQQNLILIDASNQKEYLENHLMGAQFIDLNSQLADIKEDASIGGRHPLPSITDFSQTISNLGISLESHVIVYDRSSGANAAARFWWMLKAMGNDKVQVLNGGFQTAEKEGFPIDSEKVEHQQAEPYDIKDWKLNKVDINKVKNSLQQSSTKIIDVRSPERYRGENEPIDLVAGHIPSAINIPFLSNLDENGLFLKPQILKEKYQKALGDSSIAETIVYCGSGVTACHSILAMAYAGMEIPKLYVGSWSEWSRNKDNLSKN